MNFETLLQNILRQTNAAPKFLGDLSKIPDNIPTSCKTDPKGLS